MSHCLHARSAGCGCQMGVRVAHFWSWAGPLELLQAAAGGGHVRAAAWITQHTRAAWQLAGAAVAELV